MKRRAPGEQDLRAAFRVQVVDVGFYCWLEWIGLTPRKSLTLGPLAIPDHVFLDFTRGLLDGDGSIKTDIVVPNPQRYPNHRYQRLCVQFHSASERHVVWLRSELRRLLGLRGWVGVRTRGRYSPFYTLRYSKHESITLLTELYRDTAAPRLERKWAKWNDFCLNGMRTRMWSRRRSGEIGDTRSPQERVGREAREGSTPSSGTS